MVEIRSELLFVCGSFLSGVAVMLAYEAVNVCRKLFHLRWGGRLIFDLCFFMTSAVAVFQMIFQCNHGIMRSYFVVAFALGAILYRITFGTRISEGVLKGIRWWIRQLFRPYHWFCKKFSKKP